MKFIQHPAEFRLELFASEPDIVKPITFSFDERGRLWVIEARDYPNLVLQGAPGHDRIKILEDTDDDGRADKITVFADRLNLPSSLVFANGGVIVAAAPHMLFLKDTNGDDKADVREILSTGWGTRDSHAGPSNLQYAPDNHIWGVVGYSGYEGAMNGRQLQFLQGVYRFKPDGSGFEFLTGSTNNTWGLGFSETFDVFGSTANNEPSFYLAIPNRYFEDVPGLGKGMRGSGGPGYQGVAQFYAAHYVTPYIRQVDVHGGYTAAAGHHLYTARSFPQAYWNRIAFITEPTAHLVGQGIVEKQGAGFVTRDGWNLLAGAEEWVAPVHAQVGPDGAVWVADWYNFISQHNPDAARLQQRPGQRLRDVDARPPARSHLSRGLPGRGAFGRHVAVEERPCRPLACARVGQHALAAPRAAPARRARRERRRAGAHRSGAQHVGRRHRHQRCRVARAVDLARSRANGERDQRSRSRGVAALRHPAAGVRKAAAMVLPTQPGVLRRDPRRRAAAGSRPAHTTGGRS